jgi:translation initiation factor 3 subunit B
VSCVIFRFCFIKFRSKESVEKAVKSTNNFQLDKKHAFKVNPYSDMYKYSDVPDTYVEPEVPPFVPRPDPTSWLADPLGRDQFAARYGHETEIQWNNAASDPELVYGGEREKQSGKSWCESYIKWSSRGTYLATFHPQGIRLWGGEQFESIGRFHFPNVEMIDFSPCENFLVTARLDPTIPGDPNEAVAIWDIRTGAKVKTFAYKSPLDLKSMVQTTVVEKKAPPKPAASTSGAPAAAAAAAPKSVEKVVRGIVTGFDTARGTLTITEGNTVHENVPIAKVTPLQDFNVLRWSPDGQYVAKLGADIIQVYETSTMQLLDKKSLAAKDVLEFSWSPRNNMLSYYSPGSVNFPALINIVELPSRRDVCSRKLFDVLEGRMSWQSEGEYLCVYMTKQQGKKKSYVLMFFRTGEENVPVEQIELSEPILHFSWEHGGSRFAIIYGEARNPTVDFYTMGGGASAGKASNGVTLLHTITGKQYGEVIWSPAGGVAAVAQFASDACLFDFYDVETGSIMASRRHDRGNRLTWDASGRYLASCTIVPLRGSGLNARAISDDGYNIYTFQGVLISQVRRERLYQFAWRPRPKDILSAEERSKVAKNIKKYERIFEKEDKAKRSEVDKALLETRFQLASEFFKVMSRRRQELAGVKKLRVALRNGYDEDDDSNYEVSVQIQETVISTETSTI